MPEVVNVWMPKSEYVIVAKGDEHVGNISHLPSLQAHMIQEAQRPGHYMLDAGDAAEGRVVADPKFSLEAADRRRLQPLMQYNAFSSAHRPLARRPILKWTEDGEPVRHEDGTLHIRPRNESRILVLNQGNHDEYTVSGAGNLLRDMVCAKDLGVPYGPYSARLNIHTPDGNTTRIFLWHGYGQGLMASNAKDPEQAEANVRARLVNRLGRRWSDSHVALMGHIHRVKAWRPRRHRHAQLGPTGRPWPPLVDRPSEDTPMDIGSLQTSAPINPWHRWYAVTGTAMGFSPQLGVSTYDEKMNLDPPEPGYVKIHYRKGLLWIEPCWWDQAHERIWKPTEDTP